MPSFDGTSERADGCKPNSVARFSGRRDGHLSRVTFVARPARGAGATITRKLPGEPDRDRRSGSLLCLAPHGVFRAPALARRAVGSYPAFSPLPAALRPGGGLFSVTLSVTPSFRLPPPRVLRGMLPYGVRTFLCRLSPAAIICHPL